MASILEQTINGVTVNSVRFSTTINLETNSNVKIICNFFASDSDVIIKQERLIIPSDVYDGWGADDTYIMNWVAGELGFTII